MRIRPLPDRKAAFGGDGGLRRFFRIQTGSYAAVISQMVHTDVVKRQRQLQNLEAQTHNA